MSFRAWIPPLLVAALCSACTRTEPRAGASRDASAWLEAVRDDLARPRRTSFLLRVGSAETQTGDVLFLDREHFRVTSFTRMSRSRPDGPTEMVSVTTRAVADGKQLRILLPGTFVGTPTLAFLPVERIPELEFASTQFRIELLEPIHLAAALVDRFEVQRFERIDSPGQPGRVLLFGALPSGTLTALGLGGTDAADSGADTEILLDAASARLLSITLHASTAGERDLLLELPGLEQPDPDQDHSFTLALPPGAATMDLARFLPTPSPTSQ